MQSAKSVVGGSDDRLARATVLLCALVGGVVQCCARAYTCLNQSWSD
jgi:hypothetical protein